MTKYRDNRIWKHTRVDELANGYLQEHELPSADVAFVGEHMERAYRVQYAETDAEFVFRALAEDGVASYSDFSTEDSALVLTDDTRTHRADRVVVLPFVPPGSLTPPACTRTLLHWRPRNGDPGASHRIDGAVKRRLSGYDTSPESWKLEYFHATRQLDVGPSEPALVDASSSAPAV